MCCNRPLNRACCIASVALKANLSGFRAKFVAVKLLRNPLFGARIDY
jgi:hypothetical protein